MAGDYTKFTFDPHKDYSGLFKQQGRVDLDADWNEFIEITDRRWRAETLDILGHCIVPSTTPDAFLITPTGPGAFTIGLGRMYVDGLIAENHGLAPEVYDAGLEERHGTTEIPYNDQPYFPAPLPPPLAGTPNTTDLIYVDVWHREVTYLEDPTIQEIALGGPDTATRIQTAWQVRALQNVGPHGCSDQIAAWDALTAPSAGRLTATAVAPPASDDPCIISASGGYRGLENRLYRIEIHTAGPLGTAKFKWSRDNASVETTVEAISAAGDQITVRRIGRDQVLRFQVGDWIEVLDDHLEFQHRDNVAGHMAQVTVIDEANRILTIAPAIPAGLFAPANPLRHTRVRRWDQKLNVDANGLLDVVAGPIDIEDGIQVEFATDPAGGNFRTADYWSFPARTADGSVGPLQQAPPRGIVHHFCKLGFLTWPGTFVDCRDHWPPHCCEAGCTVTVGDGVDSHGQFTSIQSAVNALGAAGGVVCVGRGVYTITAPIQIDNTKRNVIIRGMGPATRLIFTPAEGASPNLFRIVRTEQVIIEGFFAVATSADALVYIADSNNITVRDCTLVNLRGVSADPTGAGPPPGRAIRLDDNCTDCVIERNALLAAKGVVASGGQVRSLLLRDCHGLATAVSVQVQTVENLEILHNRLRGIRREDVQQLVPAQPLTRSNIDAFQIQVFAAFRAPSSFNSFQAVGILIFNGNRVVIADNQITGQVAILGFLLINARVNDNDFLSLVGVFFLFGIMVRVANNQMFSLFVAVLHAGLSMDVLCEGNTFLGLFGIMLLSLGEAIAGLGPLLTAAFASVGIGAGTIDEILKAGQAGPFAAFGFAAIWKVHRNVFVTFLRGIHKSDAVFSGDFSAIDNTFLLCSQIAISLGLSNAGNLGALAAFLPVRHLIQGNGMKVTGRGVVSACPATMVHDNSIACTAIAVEIDASQSSIKDNVLLGLGAPQPDSGRIHGLILVHDSAGALLIAGNRLLGGPGHGILILQNVTDVRIEDNHIRLAEQNGISTASDVIFISRLRLARNQIQNCRGGPGQTLPWHSGAVVLGGVTNARILDNTIVENGPVVERKGPFHAVYVEDATGAEITGNLIEDNAKLLGLDPSDLGAILLLGAVGDILVHHNTVRNNGGFALNITERTNVDQSQRIRVHDNSFSGDVNPLPAIWVRILEAESLHFQGNQSFHAIAPPGTFPVAPAVRLSANLAIVTGNTIQAQGGPGLEIAALGAFPRGIVTSNLTSLPVAALFYPFGTLVLANNLIL